MKSFCILESGILLLHEIQMNKNVRSQWVNTIDAHHASMRHLAVKVNFKTLNYYILIDLSTAGCWTETEQSCWIWSCLTCILRKHMQECVCRVERNWSRSSYSWRSIWVLRPHGRWSWSEDNQGSMSTAMEHDIWRDRRIGVQKN